MNLETTVPVVDVGQSTRCSECGQSLRPNALVECEIDDELGIVATRCFACSDGHARADRTLLEGQLAPSIGPCGHSRLLLSGVTVVE